MRWVIVLALAGCYRPGHVDPCAISCETAAECPDDFSCNGVTCTFANGSCDTPDDGARVIDTPQPDAPTLDAGCAGLPNGLLPHRCFVPIASMALGATIDTDDSPCDVTSELGVCLIAATAITVPLTTKVTGSHPLVLWSATTIEITGTLDVSSHVAGVKGPGAGAPTVCDVDLTGAEDSTNSPAIGSGGVGGTYASAGGAGGGARGPGGPLPTSNTPVAPLVVGLHGGCSGGSGGLFPGGDGGAGGGAVYLMAHDQITISGHVIASGASGLGGGNGAGDADTGGGGGGGAGGLIAFDVPILHLEGATLIALGGAGGSGGALQVMNMMVEMSPGNQGFDPVTNIAGMGGTATIANNHGGDGSPITGAVAQGGGDVDGGRTGGGGGGGGGVGFIVRFGVENDLGTSIVHPPLQAH